MSSASFLDLRSPIKEVCPRERGVHIANGVAVSRALIENPTMPAVSGTVIFQKVLFFHSRDNRKKNKKKEPKKKGNKKM